MNPSSSQIGSTSTGLIKRVKTGDPDAWGTLYMEYGAWIYAMARSAHVPSADCGDIVQEVLQHFALKAADFDPASFRGWLRRCTERRVADYFRQRSKYASGMAVGGSDFVKFLGNVPDVSDPEDSSTNATDAWLFSALGLDEVEAAPHPTPIAADSPAFQVEGDWAASRSKIDPITRAKQIAAITAQVRQRTSKHGWTAFLRVCLLEHRTDEVASDLGMTRDALHASISRTRIRLRKALALVDPSFAAALETEPAHGSNEARRADEGSASEAAENRPVD
ncbi:MAG: RNA polymerase sigma factor [Planctomycetota bacterium]